VDGVLHLTLPEKDVDAASVVAAGGRVAQEVDWGWNHSAAGGVQLGAGSLENGIQSVLYYSILDLNNDNLRRLRDAVASALGDT
jgi:hypothetical protein